MLDSIFIYVIAAAFIVAAVSLFIIQPILWRKEKEKQLEELDEAPDGSEPLLETAEITEKRIDEGYSGGRKLPTYETAFILVFRTESGETKEFCVERELYDKSFVGQKGDLVTVNQGFFDFGDGEEIADEEQ